MALKPRAPRGRSNAYRNGPAPGPPSSTDPRHRRPARAKYRPGREPAPEATSSSLDAVLDAFTESWERGERPRAEGYLELLEPEDSAELIYHEYCLAEGSHLTPDPDDYLRRFPDHADRLARLFALHGAFPSSTLRDWAGPAELPSSGDEIGPYRLVRELGRGAFARVFLAEQIDLDHRLVVLKVSTRSTAEPRLLARARHPHIVEVLRHATTDDGALHLVCMPFLGGATLASVLEVGRTIGRRPRSGRGLLANLDRTSAPEYPRAELVGPAREVLDRLSYPQSLAWIVARLAEALDHAYDRGVAHGDLKPSNVLITAGGVPLLLDMNLATDWRADDVLAEGPAANMGGTLAYMAPERLLAIARRGEGASSKADDSHRADLYALGLVLLEALTGEPPEVPRGRPKATRELAGDLAWLRRVLPGSLLGRGDRSIPPALRSILAKCLAPDPLARYSRGNELAEDLDLWRSDRPLVIAEEPRRSVLARSARRRRFPLIASGLTLAAAAIVAWVASVFLEGSKSEHALSRYSMIVDQPESGAYTYRRVGQWRDDELSDPAEASARQLGRYDVLFDFPPYWRERDDVRSLPDRERGELEVWIFEQILRHAVALRQRDDSPDAWKRALALLERTLARASSAPLEAERATLLEHLKRPDQGPVASTGPSLPRWMDRYLAGVAAEPLHAREALDHYLEALRLRPGLFWAHYRASVVAGRIGEYEVEVKQLRGCIDRYPKNPALHLLLAASLCYAEKDTPRPRAGSQFADALVECGRAVQLDPDYARAYRTRALIRHASGWDEGAKADIERHAQLMARSGPASAMNLDLSLRLNLQPGPNQASPQEALHSLARKVLDNDPRDRATRTRLAARLSLTDRPAEAFAEFDKVLESDPGHLLARYQRALLIHRSAPREALAEYSALIEHPRFEELFVEQPDAIRAFHHVATDLLKRGKIAEAREVALRALAHVSRSRLLRDQATHARQKPGVPNSFSPTGETYYLLARIHAGEAAVDRGQIDRVVDCLERAFAIDPGFRDVWFAKDVRFDGLRDDLSRRLTGVVVDR
jgi:serine/threonine protein kinase/Tfp pilus assembly protein PilF